MGEAVALHDVTVAHGPAVVVDGVDLQLPAGRITVLAGPNGCGKSTLLGSIRRLLKPRSGRVTLDRDDVTTLSERALARRIALLGQTPSAPEDITVFELVKLGRFAHQTFFRQWSEADAAAVSAAVSATGLGALLDRRIDALSGGQRQRVWLAMVLAQDAPTICLDEPVNHLDVAHQLECLDLVRRLNRDMGKTVIVVLHDLNLAARVADHLVLMKAGRIVAAGEPSELLTEDLVRQVFGIESRIIVDPVHGGPLCIPISSVRASAPADT